MLLVVMGNVTFCGAEMQKARECEVKCPHCGKIEHMAQNCFELEANDHMRPQDWRGRRQTTVNEGDGTVQTGNGSGVSQEVVHRPCGNCQTPAHQQMWNREQIGEEGASLRGSQCDPCV